MEKSDHRYIFMPRCYFPVSYVRSRLYLLVYTNLCRGTPFCISARSGKKLWNSYLRLRGNISPPVSVNSSYSCMYSRWESVRSWAGTIVETPRRRRRSGGAKSSERPNLTRGGDQVLSLLPVHTMSKSPIINLRRLLLNPYVLKITHGRGFICCVSNQKYCLG